jgi:hypothetical protein
MSAGDDDRPRRSWSEIDRMRDKPRSSHEERRPRGEKAEARARAATKEYLKGLDGLFAKDKGGAEGERLAGEIREAHGTPGLADACRAYREAVGTPSDPALLALFLDADEPALVVEALEALQALQAAGALEPTPGLRRQVRMLSEGFNDEVAEAAELLLDDL